MQDIIRDYDPEHIWNMDEFALFYKQLPNRSISLNSSEHGVKQPKDRVTGVVFVNAVANGTHRRNLYVICKCAPMRFDLLLHLQPRPLLLVLCGT